ncbi:unnamed protein product [Phytophthora fragariaefolia]|uniref:Unnamed protein product n=1 Tax=Phytophthora fragariaefolia TaxID=1490495 RepID=A0A9W6YA77_9STRA|nr:unnamed protein product [Phytophthora fragariaefolia]
MIGRYEFNLPPKMISEQQWIDYFKQALSPSHIDHATVDEAMKKLRMETRWPEPESRMMNLQADMEAILDEFNLTDVAFANQQLCLVKYIADALAPPSFKAVIATKLTLRENKTFKNEVVPLCSWVTKLMKEFMTWEHAAQAATGHASSSQQQGGRRGNNGGRGGEGARGANGGRGASAGVSNSGRNNGAGSPPTVDVAVGRRKGRQQLALSFLTLELTPHWSPEASSRLDQTGRSVQVSRVDGVKLSPVGERVVDVSRIATFKEVVLTTSAWPLVLRNLAGYVEDENHSLDLTVGRPIMKFLGYSTDNLLVDARSNKPEWNLGGSTLEKKAKPS